MPSIKNVLSKTLIVPAAVMLGVLAAMPMAANADTVVNFALAPDGTTGSIGGVNLGTNTYSAGGLMVTSGAGTTLSARNDGGNEVGLGVCGASSTGNGGVCNSALWNGEWDELDNRNGLETITISEVSTQLTGTFTLGSLDGSEQGQLTSGSNFINFGTDGITSTSAAWAGSTITQVGTSAVWTLVINGFDTSTISQVVFAAGHIGAALGGNNDYLVRSANVVPIPAAAWLFASALLGLAGIARRKQA